MFAARQSISGMPAWHFLNKRLNYDGALALAVAAVSSEIRNELPSSVVPLADLLPDPELVEKLSWVKVKDRVPKSKMTLRLVDRKRVNDLLSSRNDRLFGDLSEEIFPPRTKTDLALRRSRLLDWIKYFRKDNREKEMEEVLYKCRDGWDLIFVTNLLVAVAVLGMGWWRRWYYLGAFDSDLTHYIDVTKKVSDLAKTTGIADENWTYYVECSVLSGYRNPPFPGFDLLDEAKKLAQGGEEHEYFGNTWDALCAQFLPMEYHHVEYLPFSDWVQKAEWLTSGSSSLGYLELVDVEGKKIRIKARKNMVADLLVLSDLAEDCLAFTGQTNFVIIKSELGKMRLAVSSDLYNYLKMTWITKLLGGANYDWPGNTSEEQFEQQTNRLSRMLTLCSKCIGMPFDYKAFDHQPTTDELLGIVKHLCKHAELNVPYEHVDAFREMVAGIVNGFKTATLGVKLDGLDETYSITGGLASGLRWTAIVGNAWNSVMTGLALKLLEDWGIPTDQIERFIRGDDSAIFLPNWASGAAMDLAYKAIGVKGGEGKFSLQLNQMEFLRVWMNTRCWGYPVRAIPGYTQRKPWSNQPWSEDMVLKALYENTRTLRRRVSKRDKELESIWSNLRHVWCQKHGLPDSVSWTPVHAGGYGIEPPKIGERWSMVPPVPKADRTLGLNILNQTSWRADTMTEYAKTNYNIVLGDQASEIARTELLQTVSSDNVPEIAKRMRQDWLEAVKKARCRGYKVKEDLKMPGDQYMLRRYQGGDIGEWLAQLRASCPLFGSCPEIETARADYTRFKVKSGFKRWLMDFFPRAYSHLQYFHKSWHVSESLDYLSGTFAMAPRTLHPALVGVLGKMVAAELLPRRRSTRGASVWMASALEPGVCASYLSQFLYWW